jgi:hypothetical protein
VGLIEERRIVKLPQNVRICIKWMKISHFSLDSHFRNLPECLPECLPEYLPEYLSGYLPEYLPQE